MNILIFTDSFPPEIRSASHLMYELSENLIIKGNKIVVITTFPKYNLNEIPNKYRKKIFLKENYNGITTFRLFSLPIHNVPHIIRAISQWVLAIIFMIVGLIPEKIKVILVYSPPITLGLSAYFVSQVKKTPFIFNVQDLFPQNAIDLGILKNKFLIKIYKKVEIFIYKKAKFITVHSEGNKRYIQKHGTNKDKIKVIYNWVDTDFIKPLSKLNDFRKKYKLNNKFVVSFAGVIGLAQDLISVIKAASILKDIEDILFLLAGDGLEKERLEREVLRLNLKNVIFLPFQERVKYPELIAASDICLVTLKKSMKTPVVPGKLQSIMAGGRPVLLSVPTESDARKIVSEAMCGICIEPENPEEMAKAILCLYKDRSLAEKMGKNGRKYAEKSFSLNICSKKYEKLFFDACKKSSLET